MNICKICHSVKTKLKFVYKSKPKGETDFNIDKKKYYREFFECYECGHMFSDPGFEITNFYEGSYTNKTYGLNLLEKFNKIISLPFNESDNEGRFQFLKKKCKKILNSNIINILDVGSGLGIFPWRVKKENWNITALDPDPQNINHIKNEIGIKTIQGDFLKVKIPNKYNLITFNKVIEHIKEPKEFIIKAKSIIEDNSLIYIEVPDVKAAKYGKDREEFFIEHFHVFSEKSIRLLINGCGLKCLCANSFIEPSGKFTLRAILSN